MKQVIQTQDNILNQRILTEVSLSCGKWPGKVSSRDSARRGRLSARSSGPAVVLQRVLVCW
jgi:hypothetical protein